MFVLLFARRKRLIIGAEVSDGTFTSTGNSDPI